MNKSGKTSVDSVILHDTIAEIDKPKKEQQPFIPSKRFELEFLIIEGEKILDKARYFNMTARSDDGAWSYMQTIDEAKDKIKKLNKEIKELKEKRD